VQDGDVRPKLVEMTIELPVIDVPSDGIDSWIGELSARPFDLSAVPLLAAWLLRLADDEHVFVVSIHHIVSDGWSMGNFYRELGALYGEFANGGAAVLPALAANYLDYARRQQAEARTARIARQIDYWRERLLDPPERP